MDNTWLSAVSFNPFNHGVDITLSSLTKYYSGGNAIGGAITTSNNDYFEKIVRFSKQNGMHVSPVNAQIISNNIDHLESRIKASSQLTEMIVKKYADCLSIDHPLLENHPSHEMAKKYLKYYPSVFVMQIPASKTKSIWSMKNSGVIEYKTSFGGEHTRFDTYPKTVNNLNNGRMIQSIAVTHCRMALGYNDTVEDVIKGIDQFIANIGISTNNTVTVLPTTISTTDINKDMATQKPTTNLGQALARIKNQSNAKKR